MDNILEDLILVGAFYQRVVAASNLTLTRGRNLVMVYFHLNAHLLHDFAHRGT